MKPLLQNLAEMTTHRDHLRLEVSVLSTLMLQGRIVRVRALELFTLERQTMVRPRSWSQGTEVVSSAHDPSSDPSRTPLAQLPELANCIATRERSAERSEDGCHILWLPVWLGETVHACLEITQERPFKRHQRDIITGVFLVYQNYQNLLDYSERDALTGLLNRKTFDEQFARQQIAAVASALADGAPTGQWLAVVDIYHFKQVNDRFGHLYGDEVLILVANQLRSMFRSEDRVFRFGGEEFVVLLRSMTVEQAHSALERLRQAIQEQPIPQVGQITVSIGFAMAQGAAPVEVLGRADQALYYAKEHGRNQVCHYEALERSGALGKKVEHSEVELF